jgi:hypothetical protein
MLLCIGDISGLQVGCQSVRYVIEQRRGHRLLSYNVLGQYVINRKPICSKTSVRTLALPQTLYCVLCLVIL